MSILHVGIFGSYNHGKTTIAKKLSQREGTATDIAFYSFRMGERTVELVDVPGDPEKIQPALQVASIIDAGILVISAVDGLTAMTGEHILILDSLNIDLGVIALTKVDLCDSSTLKKLERGIEDMVRGTSLERFPMIETSTVINTGFEEIKNELLKIETPERKDGPFKMPVDHAFEVKANTVATGTIKRGKVGVHKTVQALPLEKEIFIRSIQSYGVELNEAKAGDRVGIGFKEINPWEIPRGTVLCEPESLSVSKEIKCNLRVFDFYKGSVENGQRLHLSIGLQFIPVIVKLKEEIKPGKEAEIELQAEKPVVTEIGEPLFLTRPELPFGQLRICGYGKVIDLG
ncbi:MAG: GTP-binding protein [Candidatus Hydrothermarchaeota archaeon]